MPTWPWLKRRSTDSVVFAEDAAPRSNYGVPNTGTDIAPASAVSASTKLRLGGATTGEVILVTGGAGFLGQHIVRLLQERATNVDEIRVFDTRPYRNKLGKYYRDLVITRVRINGSHGRSGWGAVA